MSKSYKYLDSSFVYIDPATGLLTNLLNITDPDVLLFVESGAVAKRLNELYDKPLQIHSINELFTIHKHLFQDIYSWAGKQRTVEISKDGKQFFLLAYFDAGLRYIDSQIAAYKLIPKNNKADIALKLAEILDSINYMHPFREGNGRTQREFLRLLALEKSYALNLNPPDNKNVFELYMKGTIASDIQLLSNLIFELLIPI